MDDKLQRSDEKIVILTHQEIDSMLNKFGPEGLLSLAEELKVYATRDIQQGMLEGLNDKIQNICYHTCTYFGIEEGNLMVCKHPYFNDKGSYSNLIISQDNSRDGNVPKECPLKV